jgi:hypothetical protein
MGACKNTPAYPFLEIRLFYVLTLYFRCPYSTLVQKARDDTFLIFFPGYHDSLGASVLDWIQEQEYTVPGMDKS